MPRSLSRGDVVVERARAHLVASGIRSSAPLRELEGAVRGALDGIADDLGEEVLVIRQLSLGFRAVADGSSIGGALRGAIRVALRREIARSLRAAKAPDSSGEAVLFPSEAAAVSSYLVALHRGTASNWPFRAFQSWGRDWSAVVEEIIDHGRVFAGDVLAGAFTALGPDDFAAALPPDAARGIIAAWQRRDGSASLDWTRLPPDVRSMAPSSVIAPREVALATDLVRLLAAWPPARALTVDVEDRPDSATSPSDAGNVRLPSRACGLAYWLVLLAELGIDHALVDRYPDTRIRRAARWALGRALQAGDVDPLDPTLLLFAGEEPGRAIVPVASLAPISAEALHAVALSVAAGGHLRLAHIADATVAFDGEVVVDTVERTKPDKAIAQVVRSYRERSGVEPKSVSLVDATSQDIDVVHRVDVPILPSAWRAAVRALASAVRANAPVDDRSATVTHGWHGAVIGDGTIELGRHDAERVASGAWTSVYPIVVEQRAIALRITG